MNPQSVLPQVQPAVPLPNGRPGHNGSYTPSPHPPQQAPYYPPYPYQYPVQYQQRPPQQWAPYPVHMPTGRGYQTYSPMNHYPLPQHPPQMRASPQHAPPSSPIRSIQTTYSPAPSNTSLHVPSAVSNAISNPQLAPPTPPPPPTQPTSHRTPFYPPLPWQSFEGVFPPRASRGRRRTPAPQSPSAPVELPTRPDSGAEEEAVAEGGIAENENSVPVPAEEATRQPLNLETPSSSQPPSEALSTQPTTPSSTAPPQQVTPKINTSGRPGMPIVPIIPAIPNIPVVSRQSKRPSVSVASDANDDATPSNADHLANAVEAAAEGYNGDLNKSTFSRDNAPTAPAKTEPKSWADLVRNVGKSAAPTGSTKAVQSTYGSAQMNGIANSKSVSLVDALTTYNVKDNDDSAKIAFLEPRGLVNTGNMCYMNSVLQILVFCVPFYKFLETIGRQAAHNFRSDTPLMDAMIMFMREFRIIDAAVTVDQLRMRLKDDELEQYGEAFIPEFVYEIIRRLPRFASMRRGHQQDAEEFLGFILEEMHDECSRTMRTYPEKSTSELSTPTNTMTSPTNDSNDGQDGGWLEVGPKQKAAITRLSGTITTESPVTKIFGGKLRSELRVPGMKNSVTFEPYQPLQLDIGAPEVSNIIDALKGLTKPETLHGDFNSPRGPGATATKQVTIETLPRVLILHLKRFQYDSSGGTQKIWKKIDYPARLTIPVEMFPQHKRSGMVNCRLDYRLSAVIYHHGSSAHGGHYTVDVLRQDRREWVRLDDTNIKRQNPDEKPESADGVAYILFYEKSNE